MFYIIDVDDYVRVAPENFGLPVKEAVLKELEKAYKDWIDEEIGTVIKVIDVTRIGEGIIIPEDGAIYYDTSFKLLVFKPILNELVYGKIEQITNFGAFMSLGPQSGLLHISQAMDDQVSFSKANSLLGRNTKKSLRKGDLCLARIVAISYKAMPPKIGLTMRQPGLGKLEWIEKERKERKTEAKAEVKKGEKEKKEKEKEKKK
ncbi:MAG: DNA-directed RNA polymerase [Candidatus Pacearchaeota archaeon]